MKSNFLHLSFYICLSWGKILRCRITGLKGCIFVHLMDGLIYFIFVVTNLSSMPTSTDNTVIDTYYSLVIKQMVTHFVFHMLSVSIFVKLGLYVILFFWAIFFFL